MTSRSRSLDLVGAVALGAGLGIIQLTIFGWFPIVIAAIVWIQMLRRDGFPSVPSFFWALAALALWTFLSCAFSEQPLVSFERSRVLLFYLMVPMTIHLARGRAAGRIVDVVIAVGSFSALAGIVEYAFLNYRDLGARPTGFLGHYMTFSGVIMLVLCAAVARLVFHGREWVWPAVAVPALVTALVVSESRNAWVGALAAISLILILRNWKLLIAVPVAIGVLALVAPNIAKDRARSIFDPSDPTNRDRIAMLESGRAMIKDHPLFGVGMNMVPVAYSAKYRTDDAVDPPNEPHGTRSHLHNVPVQLAAERGLPALAAWLAFVGLALRDLFALFRRSKAKALAAAGLAAVVAMVIAGLFEHNFGDTEFLVLFLGLISLPFAAAANDPASPTPVPLLVGRGSNGSASATERVNR